MSSSLVELDELRLLVIVDNETDTLSTVAEGVPQLSQPAHLAPRLPAVRHHNGLPCKVVLDRLCWAGHGLSVLVTARRGDEEHNLLLDVGPYPELWKGNAERLGIDLATIEAVFLSHWHFDHSGALPEVVAAIAGARKRAGLSAPVLVDLHPDRPDQRGTYRATDALIMLPAEPSFTAIEAAAGRVDRHADAHEMCNGFLFGSGLIDRVTDYETGLVGHHSLRGNTLEADPLILDERFVAAHVRGRGLTVLSSCSHAGVVNVCLSAQKAFPSLPIDVVLGGFHLSGRGMESRIDATVRDLQNRVRPKILAPGHCTGWRAKASLAHAFAPEHYGPSSVGSLYVLKNPQAR